MSYVSGLFVASRLLVLAFAILAPLLVAPGSYSRGSITDIDWTLYFNRWDVEWYRLIAVDGYSYVPGVESNVAFFPLFPLLIRGLHAVGVDAIVAGMIVANACFAAALWVFFGLIWRETGRRRLAENATALLAFSPAAAWFTLGLTESLYLLLTVSLAATVRAEKGFGALLVGALAGLTRPNSLLLILPVAVLVWPVWRDAWRERRWRSVLLWTLVVSGPLIGHAAFLGFLHQAFGDWRLQQIVAKTYWHNQVSLTWEAFAQRIPGLGLKLFERHSIYLEYVAWSWTLVLFGGAIAAIALWEHRAPKWHLALLAAFFGFHAFLLQGFTPIGSIARYAAVVPAFYLGFALLAERWRWAQPVALACCAGTLVLQTVLIFAGYHIN